MYSNQMKYGSQVWIGPEEGHLWDGWLSMTLKLHKSVNSIVFILSFCFDSGSLVVMLALEHFMEGIDTEHFCK